MLDDRPSQSGIAYPKFYAWVKLSKSNVVVVEGVVRLAAVAKTRFEITDFFAWNELKKRPLSAVYNFPDPIEKAILAKLKSNE